MELNRGEGRVYYTDSDKEKLEKRVKRLEQERNNARDRAATIDRSRSAYMGQVTRLKNRAANGVCPCCTRHFQNLQAHMAKKHPDYTEPAG